MNLNLHKVRPLLQPFNATLIEVKPGVNAVSMHELLVHVHEKSCACALAVHLTTFTIEH